MMLFSLTLKGQEKGYIYIQPTIESLCSAVFVDLNDRNRSNKRREDKFDSHTHVLQEMIIGQTCLHLSISATFIQKKGVMMGIGINHLICVRTCDTC